MNIEKRFFQQRIESQQVMLFEAARFNGWTLMERELLNESENMGLPLQARLLKRRLLLLNKDKGLTEAQADVHWRQKYANVWYAHAMYEVALEQ